MRTVKISTPGSTFIMGEHAVLYGSSAVVAALNCYIHVTASFRSDRQIHLKSSLGNYKTPVDAIQPSPLHRFAVEIFRQWAHKLSVGLDITIESDFSEQVGLGSSAAVTVALLKSVSVLTDCPLSSSDLLKSSIEVIQNVQGAGSGGDAAASVYGGIIAYNPTDLSVQKLTDHLPIHLFYSGYKTPTADVIVHVKKHALMEPQKFKQLYLDMSRCTNTFIHTLKTNTITDLAIYMDEYQSFMASLGVSDDVLNRLINKLKQEHPYSGVKISGSGLGDCVIMLGDLNTSTDSELAAKKISVTTASQGCTYELITT